MVKWFVLAGLACGAAAAAGRSDLSGNWQLDRSHSDASDEKLKTETLDILQTEDGIQIADSASDLDGKERKSDIRCNTLGKECKLKGEQVSLWYNGPVLVMMETHGGSNLVVKRSLKTSDDGQTMSMEVTTMTTGGQKTESLKFVKQPVTAAKR